VHSVAETNAYLAAAEAAGMTAEERQAAVDTLAHQPDAGDKIQGTGGCRKVRVAGKGKSGGYRVITAYSGEDFPVFLLTVFGKGEKDNLSKAERNALAKLTKALFETYRRRRGL
jgi:hypothetical protein